STHVTSLYLFLFFFLLLSFLFFFFFFFFFFQSYRHHRDLHSFPTRRSSALPPSVAAVVRDPQPAVVAREHVLGVVGIDPQVVQVAVHAVEAADDREALAAVLGEDQVAVGLGDALGVPGIDVTVDVVARSV